MAPVDGLHLGVEVVGIDSRELLKGFEHTQCGAEPEVRLVEQLLVAQITYHAVADGDVFATQLLDFFGQNFLEASEGFSNYLEFFHKAKGLGA